MKTGLAVLAYRDTKKGRVCENFHAASAVISTQTKASFQMFPDSKEPVVFMRSAAKPFQAIPLLRHPNSSSITLEQWAIICASHSASPRHLELVREVLKMAESPEADYRCGPPMSAEIAESPWLACSKEKATPIHNNCSGKHAGMLLACLWYGWPKDTYLEPEHPLQQAILEIVKTWGGATEVPYGVDGCGAPVFAVPLSHTARMFARLITNPETEVLVKAMTTYADIVGDERRIDSCLMRISGGRLVAKVGAEGFMGLANRDTGEGMAVKIHDGNNPMRGKLVIALLEKHGWLKPSETEQLWQMPSFSKDRLNSQGKVIGQFDFQLG